MGRVSDTKQGWKEKLDAFGTTGVVVWFALFLTTLFGFAALISSGLAAQIPWIQEHSEVGSGATFVVAYALTQLSKPVRIVLTLAITPIILRDRKSTRLNSSHIPLSRMPSSA